MATPFDFRSDVPHETWENVARQVVRFLDNPKATGVIEDLAILVEVNPAVQAQLKQDPLFIAALKDQVQVKWAKFETSETIKQKFVLQELGGWLSILPELRDELEPPSEHQCKGILNLVKEELVSGKANMYGFDTLIPFHFSATTIISMLRLLPDQTDQVREALDNLEYQRRFDARLDTLLAQEEGWGRFLDLADASFLYPDRADKYKQRVAPYWSAVKKEVKSFGPKLNVYIKSAYLIWAASVFGADRAYIDSKGDLQRESIKPPRKQPTLPNRFVGLRKSNLRNENKKWAGAHFYFLALVSVLIQRVHQRWLWPSRLTACKLSS